MFFHEVTHRRYLTGEMLVSQINTSEDQLLGRVISQSDFFIHKDEYRLSLSLQTL